MSFLGFDPDSMAGYYAEQGFNAMLDGEYTEEGVDPEPLPVSCKYCGRKELHWATLPEGYRLVNESGRVHVCKKYSKKVPK